MATNTHPAPWYEEDEQTIMTIVDILEKRAEASKPKKRR